MPNSYVLTMVDGHCFSKMIKHKFDRPFDDMFIKMMNETAKYLCENIQGAKFDGCKGFKAFDVNEGRQVGNLIYASLMENTPKPQTTKGIALKLPVYRAAFKKFVKWETSTLDWAATLPHCQGPITNWYSGRRKLMKNAKTPNAENRTKRSQVRRE